MKVSKLVFNLSHHQLHPHLVAVMNSRDNLSEEVSGLPFAEPSMLADVIVQLALTGIFHHDHNLILILEHCELKQIQQRLIRLLNIIAL